MAVAAMTLTAPERQDTEAGDEVDHLYCCDENVAVCGLDLTGVPEIEPGSDNPLCPLCHLVYTEGLPCPVSGCQR